MKLYTKLKYGTMFQIVSEKWIFFILHQQFSLIWDEQIRGGGIFKSTVFGSIF